MAHVTLSNTGDWELKFDEQDVRGYDALDANGNKVGEVDQMVIDTAERRVDTIILEDGTRYPARDISIGDGVVYLTKDVGEDLAGTVTVYDDYGHVVDRERIESPNFDAHADAFREHYTTAYASTGKDYDDYDSAYRYGYETAHHEDYRNRAYTDAENDLESGYMDGDFSEVRDAVRYGYTRARRGR